MEQLAERSLLTAEDPGFKQPSAVFENIYLLLTV